MVECCNGPYLRSLFHIFWLHFTDSWKDLLHLQNYPGVTEAFLWAWSLAGLSDTYHMTHPSTTLCSEIQNIFNMHNWHNKETNRQLRLWLGNCSTIPRSGWSSLHQKKKKNNTKSCILEMVQISHQRILPVAALNLWKLCGTCKENKKKKNLLCLW